jgi:U3 small nucleolar RNA-associated protein 10
VDAACARVVDALPDAPDHRRAGLVSAFLKATDLCVNQHEVGGNPETNAETDETKKRMSSSTDRAMGLAIVARELLTRAESLEAAAEASARRRAAKAARRAAKEGGAAAAAALEAIEMEKARAIETASAWVGNLVATLLARETATAAVSALVRVAEVRQILFAFFGVFRAKSRYAIDDATRRDYARYSTPAASETSR